MPDTNTETKVPAKPKSTSAERGVFQVSLPKEYHDILAKRADADDRPVSYEVRRAVRSYLKEYGIPDPLAKS